MTIRIRQQGWLLLSGALLSLWIHSAAAEIYRWTDSEGKVHYSDRKLNRDAEDVTAKVRVQNIDTSQEEQRKLQQIFREENEADREYHRQQQEARKPSAEHRQRCNELQRYIRDIDGRVQFIDDNGKPIRVTENERKQMVEETRQLWNERCSGI